MGRVDVMDSQNLVDCYFSPFLHRRMGGEMVISINNSGVVMRDSISCYSSTVQVGLVSKINGQKEGFGPSRDTAWTPKRYPAIDWW
jgi:hypothetical protein